MAGAQEHARDAQSEMLAFSKLVAVFGAGEVTDQARNGETKAAPPNSPPEGLVERCGLPPPPAHGVLEIG